MPPRRSEHLRAVIDETRRLFHRLANLAEHIHEDLGIRASERAVLEFLWHKGPHTVPQIARAKEVSRQHIQTIVNALMARDLVDTRDNPAHQRSQLIGLTEPGERCFCKVHEREVELLRRIARRFQATDLETTTTTMRDLGEVLHDLNHE